MENIQWFDIVWAVILVYFIWRMFPLAKNWLENGPKGSASDWMTTGLLLLGVALFILFLISVV